MLVGAKERSDQSPEPHPQAGMSAALPPKPRQPTPSPLSPAPAVQIPLQPSRQAHQRGAENQPEQLPANSAAASSAARLAELVAAKTSRPAPWRQFLASQQQAARGATFPRPPMAYPAAAGQGSGADDVAPEVGLLPYLRAAPGVDGLTWHLLDASCPAWGWTQADVDRYLCRFLKYVEQRYGVAAAGRQLAGKQAGAGEFGL